MKTHEYNHEGRDIRFTFFEESLWVVYGDLIYVKKGYTVEKSPMLVPTYAGKMLGTTFGKENVVKTDLGITGTRTKVNLVRVDNIIKYLTTVVRSDAACVKAVPDTVAFFRLVEEDINKNKQKVVAGKDRGITAQSHRPKPYIKGNGITKRLETLESQVEIILKMNSQLLGELKAGKPEKKGFWRRLFGG